MCAKESKNDDVGQLRPSRKTILAAKGKTVADVIADNLQVLFCGINPGLYSGAVGHHFARPGNRFWPVMHAAGYTDTLLTPSQERQLLDTGYGITNLVARATASASELSSQELVDGALVLEEKIRKHTPTYLAVLGIGAYRHAFRQPKAIIGKQERCIAGTRIWVLPNPSGLNAHYQIDDLVQLFRELRLAILGE